MKSLKSVITTCLGAVLLSIFSSPVWSAEKMPSIPFGTIPVLQSLPLFVAAEKGFFKEQGLDVEIILFNSAMEKDIALTSGRIVGYFGDLMTPMVLQANNTGIKITATNFNTTPEQRMFAILASSQSANKSLEEIISAGVATSNNTISEYLITRLLQQRKIGQDKITFIDVKSIPIRLQMLLSSQVPAALLPEPLASLAETKGAKVLLDDKGRGFSATVLAFSEKFIKSHSQAVKAFHAAVNKAAEYINRNPKEVRGIMNRECKIPDPFRDVFPIPRYPKLTAPSTKQVMDVLNWLQEKKIITRKLTYKDLVADGFLP
jgi:NitT/TauT family transport system substrate-binding protein